MTLEDALIHGIMNPQFPPLPPQRDLAQETEDTLRVLMMLQPEIFASEARWRPEYAVLDALIMQEVLSGRGGLLDYHESTLIPYGIRQTSAIRDADIADLERLGPRATEALLAADPNQQALMEELNRQAMEELRLGGQLSPDEIRDVTQATRAGYSDRGMIRSEEAILDEIMNRSSYQQARQAQRRDFAGQVVGYNRAVTGDPMMAILGRPSDASGTAASVFGMGHRNQTASGMFDPMNPYASSLYAGNQQAATSIYGSQAGLMGSIYGSQAGLYGGILGAQTSQDISRRERDAALMGGGLEFVGNIFCWVAREVYGEDNPQWKRFRLWLFTNAPTWFFRAYMIHGERIAGWLKGKGLVKRMVRRWMDRKVMEVCHAV